MASTSTLHGPEISLRQPWFRFCVRELVYAKQKEKHESQVQTKKHLIEQHHQADLPRDQAVMAELSCAKDKQT